MEHTFLVEFLFGRKYHGTIDSLEKTYKPMISWLEINCKDNYVLKVVDNSTHSDINDDPLIGYVVRIYDDEGALAFKLKWL